VADFQFMTGPVMGTIVAQGDSVGCRSVVDGVVNGETIAHKVSAATFGPLTAA
jgi:Mycobacterium membrane protein